MGYCNSNKRKGVVIFMEITRSMVCHLFTVYIDGTPYNVMLHDNGDIYSVDGKCHALPSDVFEELIETCRRGLANPYFIISDPVEGTERTYGGSATVYEFSATLTNGCTLYTLTLSEDGKKEVSRSKTVNNLSREDRRLLLKMCQTKLQEYLAK